MARSMAVLVRNELEIDVKCALDATREAPLSRHQRKGRAPTTLPPVPSSPHEGTDAVGIR